MAFLRTGLVISKEHQLLIGLATWTHTVAFVEILAETLGLSIQLMFPQFLIKLSVSFTFSLKLRYTRKRVTSRMTSGNLSRKGTLGVFVVTWAPQWLSSSGINVLIRALHLFISISIK